MLTVVSAIAPKGPDSYYTAKWRTLIEDHLDYLRAHQDTVTIEIQGIAGYHHRYDLFSVFVANKIPAHFHWAIMRVNGYISPLEFEEETKSLLVPSAAELNKLNRLVSAS